MKTRSFEGFASWCAILAGVAAFLYAVAFIVIARSDPALGGLLSSLFLLLLGLLYSAALTDVYERLRETNPAAALWAFVLGIAGALGAAIHGGYDLANAMHPVPSPADAASQVDPRGLLTFGVAGLALLAISWLIVRGGQFPRGLAYLGYVSAVLLVVLYLARLIILSPAHPLVLVPAVVNGFLVGPAWYVWLGLALRRVPR